MGLVVIDDRGKMAIRICGSTHDLMITIFYCEGDI